MFLFSSNSGASHGSIPIRRTPRLALIIQGTLKGAVSLKVASTGKCQKNTSSYALLRLNPLNPYFCSFKLKKMAEVIRMPKMSDTMTEGVIVSWMKKVGDDIKPGDILAEVETDKA